MIAAAYPNPKEGNTVETWTYHNRSRYLVNDRGAVKARDVAPEVAQEIIRARNACAKLVIAYANGEVLDGIDDEELADAHVAALEAIGPLPPTVVAEGDKGDDG